MIDRDKKSGLYGFLTIGQCPTRYKFDVRYRARSLRRMIAALMIRGVFSSRCKCGVRLKVIGETEGARPMANSTVKCPACGEEHSINASKVLSVTQGEDAMLLTNTQFLATEEATIKRSARHASTR